MTFNNYGSDVGGGFNALSRAYKNEPSIENYVKLRRDNPDGEIEVSVIGGLDELFYMEPELRKFGIDPHLVAGAMDADHDAVSELSLQLMEKLIEARELKNSGETHLVRRGLAIPDKLVDWIIACSLDAISWTDQLEIPRDLIVLIRERLGGAKPHYKEASRAHHNKSNAAMMGGQLLAQGVKPTLRILGNLLGVAPSTVKRWFEDGEFECEIERWSHFFDEKGNILPLEKVKKRRVARK